MNAGGGAGMPSTTCPTSPPTEQACATGLSCSYGADLRPACRNHYDCVAGMWSAKASACKALESCAMRDGGVPQVGAACTTIGEDCTLDGGTSGTIYCRCDQHLMTNPVTAEWDCIGPPASPCPQIMPNVGQACASNGESCTYGSCSMPANDNMTVQCTARIWKAVASGCVVAN
jgi:hypothetical protein